VGFSEPEDAGYESDALANRDQAAILSKLDVKDAPDAMESVSAGPHAPRRGSKLAQVIELLHRDHGATVDELIAATGWLAHTTRAALSGLRKRGYAVAIDRSDHERGSFYRIKAEGYVAPVALTFEKPADSPTPRKPAQRLSKPQARRTGCASRHDFLRRRIARHFRSLPRQGAVSVGGPAILRGNSWRLLPKVSGRKFPFPRLLFAACPPHPDFEHMVRNSVVQAYQRGVGSTGPHRPIQSRRSSSTF